MTRTTIATKRHRKSTFWAWTVSIAAHLIVLTAFGLVKFSQSKPQDKQRPIPMAKVTRIKKLMQAVQIIPKPKIKKTLDLQSAKRTNKLLPISRTFDTAKPGPYNLNNLSSPPALAGKSSLTSDGILPHRVEFFGSWTDEHKIYYVVDCSGSMKGMFGQVRGKLKDSIASLQPDQYFCIIFFGSGRLFEFGDDQLVRATKQTKSAAYDFIDSVQPKGLTNALAALEKAVQIRDGSGLSPSVIYFLTDGFELTTEDSQRFSQKVANLLRQFAPATKINTIGFWPQSTDRKMLETIAEQSGGECLFITEDNN